MNDTSVLSWGLFIPCMYICTFKAGPNKFWQRVFFLYEFCLFSFNFNFLFFFFEAKICCNIAMWHIRIWNYKTRQTVRRSFFLCCCCCCKLDRLSNVLCLSVLLQQRLMIRSIGWSVGRSLGYFSRCLFSHYVI